ncbi:hypothetical protein F5884DRAFT_680453 [Xylogone sp. PMI_703]|nr:hypothetical protein F5884DRAFT_680453 [Xylogone sp. PMI_703]
MGKKRTVKRDIVKDFTTYFGEESKLANWQKLCRDLGMLEIPPSITKCRKAIKKVSVNICDFVDAINTGYPIRFFSSKNELARYTRETGKIYPRKHIKKGDPASALLATIFH